MSPLDKRYVQAAEDARTLPNDLLSNAQRLKLFALFKQADSAAPETPPPRSNAVGYAKVSSIAVRPAPRTPLASSSVCVFPNVFNIFCFPERCSRMALNFGHAYFPKCFAMLLSPPVVILNVFQTFCFPQRCSRRALKGVHPCFPSWLAMFFSPPSVLTSVFSNSFFPARTSRRVLKSAHLCFHLSLAMFFSPPSAFFSILTNILVATYRHIYMIDPGHRQWKSLMPVDMNSSVITCVRVLRELGGLLPI